MVWISNVFLEFDWNNKALIANGRGDYCFAVTLQKWKYSEKKGSDSQSRGKI